MWWFTRQGLLACIDVAEECADRWFWWLMRVCRKAIVVAFVWTVFWQAISDFFIR